MELIYNKEIKKIDGNSYASGKYTANFAHKLSGAALSSG
jgi:hypothetical protein